MKYLLLTFVLLLQSAVPPGAGEGSISGRILANGGAPAATVRVAAMAVPGGPQTGEVAMMSIAQTDSAGRYRLDNVPPGRYYIAVGPVEAPAYFPGVTVQSRATVVTVAAGAAMADMDFAVELTVAQLQTPVSRPPAAALAARGARGGVTQLADVSTDGQRSCGSSANDVARVTVRSGG